jgi:FkbM family methyltransferase
MILELKTVARSFARRAGFGPALHSVRKLWHHSDYEDKFADLLLKSIRPDDCVWDIGANTGFYTRKIAEMANSVVAFEPIRENFDKMKEKELPNVEYHQIALGNSETNLSMTVAGTTSSIVLASNTDTETETVRVLRADDLHTCPRPTLIKIDVEGYEPEVILGMQRTLGGVRRASFRNPGKARHAPGSRSHS